MLKVLGFKPINVFLLILQNLMFLQIHTCYLSLLPAAVGYVFSIFQDIIFVSPA